MHLISRSDASANYFYDVTLTNMDCIKAMQGNAHAEGGPTPFHSHARGRSTYIMGKQGRAKDQIVDIRWGRNGETMTERARPCKTNEYVSKPRSRKSIANNYTVDNWSVKNEIWIQF